MNILVMGKGGREHAIIRAIKRSSVSVEHKVFVLPGQDGFKTLADCVSKDLLKDKENLKKWIQKENIKLVVIGPEQELVDGWADFFRNEGIDVFGPSGEATQLEASKLFAKKFMSSAGVPTSQYKEVCSVKEAVEESIGFDFPIVLKADGLAAGKGVFICSNKEELKKAAGLLFEEKIFGQAGEKAFLEQYQKGWELSVFILTNGEDYKLLPFARDYKKRDENNKGPNTGGMGAVAPHFISEDLQKQIHKTILKPTVTELKKRKMFYRGVLYIGLMITDKGPVVLEYNVRFGDPETQVVLPLLDGDWANVFYEVAQGRVVDVKWRQNCFSACVVLASPGYPFKPETGLPIEGEILSNLQSDTSYFLHAGVKKEKEKWLTNGGRVLNAIGLGNSQKRAIECAYQLADQVHWKNLHKRSDIGK